MRPSASQVLYNKLYLGKAWITRFPDSRFVGLLGQRLASTSATQDCASSDNTE